MSTKHTRGKHIVADYRLCVCVHGVAAINCGWDSLQSVLQPQVYFSNDSDYSAFAVGETHTDCTAVVLGTSIFLSSDTRMSHVARIFPQHASCIKNHSPCVQKHFWCRSPKCCTLHALLRLPQEEETEPSAGQNAHRNDSCSRPDKCQQPVKVCDSNWLQRRGEKHARIECACRSP